MIGSSNDLAFFSLIEYSPGPASLGFCYLMRTLEHNLKMSAKMTFSLGFFQMQRQVEPKLDRELLEYSFGIHSFLQKLRSLESHIVRAEENLRDGLATHFHSAAGETQSQGGKQFAINHMAGTVTAKACLEPKSLSCSWCAFEWFEIEINSWLNGCLNKGKAFLCCLCETVGSITLSFPYAQKDERLAAQAKETC